MPQHDDPGHIALREGLEGALTELQAQRRDQHKHELQATAELAEHRAIINALGSEQRNHAKALHGNGLQAQVARLDERLSALEKIKTAGGQLEAAKVTAAGHVKGQFYILIGALATGLGGLILGLLQLLG